MDTEPCWSVAEIELFARRGLPFGPDEKALVIGTSLPAAAELLMLVTEVVTVKAEPCPARASWSN
ncbi:MAG TPA: hypothetical protein VFG15_10140 [Amycolatopsis sp.]|nr:hypothetical protein [Amycolatopsis sp.]